jgi:hypothetical protein
MMDPERLPRSWELAADLLVAFLIAEPGDME